jgi:release factor glutamine methyltransferase
METARARLVRLSRRMAGRLLRPLVRRTLLDRTLRLRFEGLELLIEKGVFPPVGFGSTRFFARHVAKLDLGGRDVLEVGTGSGAIALSAARAGARVTAIDISSVAVSCAAGNAARNGLAGRMEVLQSDLFLGLPRDKRFSHILFNPPHFPEDQAGEASYPWNAGKGFSLLARFAAEAGAHLRPDGRVMLSLSADMPIPTILTFFRAAGYQEHLVGRGRWLWDTYFLYCFSPVGAGDGKATP